MSTDVKDQKVDVKGLDNSALEAKRRHAAKEAQTILDDYRAKAREDGAADDPYAIMGDEVWQTYKGHMKDLDIIEGEIQRRSEIDQGEARIKAALGHGMVAALPSGYQVSDSARPVTLGEAFVKSEVYQRHFEKTGGFTLIEDKPEFAFVLDGGFGVKNLMPGGQKAMIHSGSAVGGPLIIPEYDRVPEFVARPTPHIIDLVSRVSTGTDTVYWSNQTARSTAATAVAEATNSTGTSGTKPEATITFERKTAIVEILAVTAAVTEKELADGAQIAEIINTDLIDDLRIRLGAQIIGGSGVTPNLSGFLGAGIQTVGFSTAIGNVMDNLLRAQTVIATANEPDPDGYVLNPLDWEPMRIAKSAGDGNYFGGSPFVSMAPSLWGKPVVLDNQMTANTGVVGSFKRACRLYEREGITIRIGWVNDDFARNIVRVRAEFRAAFVTRRPSAIARVTGI